MLPQDQVDVWVAGNQPQSVEVGQAVCNVRRIRYMATLAISDDKANCRAGGSRIKEHFLERTLVWAVRVIHFDCPTFFAPFSTRSCQLRTVKGLDVSFCMR